MPELTAERVPGCADVPGKPRNAVVVLLDSLNRHLLGAYGSDEFATPNLDRFAARSLRFDRHYSGSLPCIPARHDLLVGAMDFLWRPWGSIEVWERPITAHLAEAGVTTMLVTDHPHLFETGGENYHTDFRAWEYLRGHETDPWKTRPDPSWIGTTQFRDLDYPWDRSRGWFRSEEDFPGPKTMTAAAAWLDEHAPHHDRFFLLVDEFDPHEPFDAPEPYASMYDHWEGPRLIWPPYTPKAVERGILTERQAGHIRANYGSKLTMIDAWFGRVLDALDRRHLWDDTVVIVCTDHGLYLGEHDMWGKPPAPGFDAMTRIPLLVSWPGVAPRSVDALTTTVDVFATLADLFDVTPEYLCHGRSLRPVVTDEATRARDWVLTGVWGNYVNIVTDRYTYARSPGAENVPLSMWSNRWSTMPLPGLPQFKLPPPDKRATLDFMPGTKIPVIRQPFRRDDLLPYWAGRRLGPNELYDRVEDPGQEHSLAGTPLEDELASLLRDALASMDAADDQFERLSLR